MYGLLTLALAIAARSAPIVSSGSVDFPNGFGLAMEVYQQYYSLTAVYGGESNYLYLVGKNITEVPGSLAYWNGTSPNAALTFDVNGVGYGAFVPDAGEVDGYHSPITITPGVQDPHFGYYNSSVTHQLTSARNVWLGCNITLNGNTELVLAWGNYQDSGAPPIDCTIAEVYMNCNVGDASNVTCTA